MSVPKVYESEYRFCLILWAHEPVKSKELVRLCQEQLGWKATTTYTVIKRLSQRGILKNENTVVNLKTGISGWRASDVHTNAGAVPHPCALSDGRARTDSDTRTNPDAGADSDALYRRMA